MGSGKGVLAFRPLPMRASTLPPATAVPRVPGLEASPHQLIWPCASCSCTCCVACACACCFACCTCCCCAVDSTGGVLRLHSALLSRLVRRVKSMSLACRMRQFLKSCACEVQRAGDANACSAWGIDANPCCVLADEAKAHHQQAAALHTHQPCGWCGASTPSRHMATAAHAVVLSSRARQPSHIHTPE